MSQSTELSIVIPAFNADRFLQDALESLERQNQQSFEVVMSDGGSKDSTVEIFEASSLPSKQAFSEADCGPADALNKGFKSARGQILGWLNADDVYLSPDVIGSVLQSFQNPRVDFVYGDAATLDEEGFVKKVMTAAKPIFSHRSQNIFTGSLFFRREIWDEFGGFSLINRISFEHELRDFLFRRGRPAIITFPMAGLRQHAGTLTSRYQEQIRREKKLIYGANVSPKIFSATDRFLSWVVSGRIGLACSRRFGDWPRLHWRDHFNGAGF